MMTEKEIAVVAALLADNAIHQMALADLLHEKDIINRVEVGGRVEKFAKLYYEMIANRFIEAFGSIDKADEEN